MGTVELVPPSRLQPLLATALMERRSPSYTTRLPKGRMAVLENTLAKENEVRETLLREEHALRLRLMKEDHDDKLQKRAAEHSLEMEVLKRATKELILYMQAEK